MGHEFHKCLVYMDMSNWTAPELDYIRNDKLFSKYVKKNPMPKNNTYDNEEQLEMSIMNSGGILTLDVDADENIVLYLEDLIDYMQGCNTDEEDEDDELDEIDKMAESNLNQMKKNANQQ